MTRPRPEGMAGFIVVWIGQLISVLGTGMTRFALSVWVWESTGKATPAALVLLASFGPGVILSPVAGALVDRWNRKLVMMLSDFAAGLSTIAMLFLFMSGHLQIWHIIVAGAFSSAFESFQFPAYSAAITTMVDQKHYARAEGMLSMIEAAQGIVSPIVAGVILGAARARGSADAGIVTIMTIDVITFLAAISGVLIAHIPQPERSGAPALGLNGLAAEIRYGFAYILSRPSLLGLQLVFFGLNLTEMFAFTIQGPMILARTGSDAGALAAVQTAAGVGGLAGGIALSISGGPKRKIVGLLGGMLFGTTLGTLVIGLGRVLPVWMVGSFVSGFAIPFINGSNQAIWQAKVEPGVQGRVFATRRWIAQITIPVAMALAGPMADGVFEPALRTDGVLAGSLGQVVGVGPGTGMAIMFIIAGLLGASVAITGYLVRVVREAEIILPDAVMSLTSRDKLELR